MNSYYSLAGQKRDQVVVRWSGHSLTILTRCYSPAYLYESLVVSLILQALFPFNYYVYGTEKEMFDGILGRNSENKTPLHLAVEYDHLK